MCMWMGNTIVRRDNIKTVRWALQLLDSDRWTFSLPSGSFVPSLPSWHCFSACFVMSSFGVNVWQWFCIYTLTKGLPLSPLELFLNTYSLNWLLIWMGKPHRRLCGTNVSFCSAMQSADWYKVTSELCLKTDGCTIPWMAWANHSCKSAKHQSHKSLCSWKRPWFWAGSQTLKTNIWSDIRMLGAWLLDDWTCLIDLEFKHGFNCIPIVSVNEYQRTLRLLQGFLWRGKGRERKGIP